MSINEIYIYKKMLTCSLKQVPIRYDGTSKSVMSHFVQLSVYIFVKAATL